MRFRSWVFRYLTFTEILKWKNVGRKGWTVAKILKRDGHGNRTGWEWKQDGMITKR